MLGERTEDGSVTVVPGLAESWDVADDLSYTDFTIRDGVEFHMDMGPLTAEDVAFTFNEANPNVNSEAQHDTGGDLIPVLERTEALDENTVRFHWVSYAAHYNVQWLSDYFEAIGIFSKNAWDQQGEEWMRQNVVGSGPFQIVEWTQHKGMYLEAVPDHWRKTPFVQELEYVEVPESSIRRAMLETGEAQISEADLKDWPDLLDQGFERAPEEGPINDLGIVPGGNYWEDTHAETGEPLERTLNTNLPWVGDPDDPESMERAKNVRWALALAINREAINQSILQGLGEVSNLGSIGDSDPIFQAHQDEWTVPYDPERARSLLAETGYPDGFDASFYSRPSGLEPELSETIAAMWQNELNVHTVVNRQPYQAWRPNRINRTVDEFSFHSMWSAFPATWPGEWLISSVSAPSGFNSGMEIPMASETLEKKQSTTSEEELKQYTVEFQNYIHEWMLYPGVVEAPQAAIYNPNVIVEWQMRPISSSSMGNAKSPEYIRLAE